MWASAASVFVRDALSRSSVDVISAKERVQLHQRNWKVEGNLSHSIPRREAAVWRSVLCEVAILRSEVGLFGSHTI